MFRHIIPMRSTPLVVGMLLLGASLCCPTAGFGGPNDNVAQPNQQQPPPPNNVPNVGGQPAGPTQPSTDFPGPVVHDWVIANAMAARARAVYRQSETDLNVAIRRAQLTFEHSQDYQNALNAERQAYSDYTAARDHALTALKDNVRYIEICKLRDELNARLQRERSNKFAPRDEINAMATLKLQYASDARTIEVLELDNSADVRSAHERMIAASRHVSELRSSLDSAIRDNPEIAAARKAVTDARINMLTTDAYACGAAVAGNAAVTYSYYLHRLDQGYYAPWGPAATTSVGYYSGGGGGYYTPFWNR